MSKPCKPTQPVSNVVPFPLLLRPDRPKPKGRQRRAAVISLRSDDFDDIIGELKHHGIHHRPSQIHALVRQGLTFLMFSFFLDLEFDRWNPVKTTPVAVRLLAIWTRKTLSRGGVEQLMKEAGYD